jgi:hypothetical protein
MRSELIKFDGLDGAIVGVGTRIGSADFLIYSRARCGLSIMCKVRMWGKPSPHLWKSMRKRKNDAVTLQTL